MLEIWTNFVFFEVGSPKTMSEVYEIKLPQFEGPFDLLLFFIEREELDIHNIPIAKITDDFLEYMHQAQNMNLELASEFILVAATLMRIKAKMLLPRPQIDEQGNEIDPRQDLVRQLLEYKRFKEASEELKQKEEDRQLLELRGNIRMELERMAVEYDPDGNRGELNQLTLFKLMQSFEKVMARFAKAQEDTRLKVVQYPYSIEDERDHINQQLLAKQKLDFVEIFNHCKTKIHAVFTFLAMLELLNTGFAKIFIGEGFNNFMVYHPEYTPYHAN